MKKQRLLKKWAKRLHKTSDIDQWVDLYEKAFRLGQRVQGQKPKKFYRNDTMRDMFARIGCPNSYVVLIRYLNFV